MPDRPTTPPSPFALRLSASFVIGFGVFMALGTVPPIRDVLTLLGDLIFWPLDGTQDAGDPLVRLVAAISGGVAIGWGTLIWGLSGAVFQSHPDVIRKLVLRGYVAWFLADGMASLFAGAPLNLLGNAAFFLAVWAPLRRPYGN